MVEIQKISIAERGIEHHGDGVWGGRKVMRDTHGVVTGPTARVREWLIRECVQAEPALTKAPEVGCCRFTLSSRIINADTKERA